MNNSQSYSLRKIVQTLTILFEYNDDNTDIYHEPEAVSIVTLRTIIASKLCLHKFQLTTNAKVTVLQEEENKDGRNVNRAAMTGQINGYTTQMLDLKVIISMRIHCEL